MLQKEIYLKIEFFANIAFNLKTFRVELLNFIYVKLDLSPLIE
jgi:hypothetical protein